MLKVEATLTPFRMKLDKKEPIQLKVTVRNMGGDDELVSYDVLVSRSLSLDHKGFKTSDTSKAGTLEPGQAKQQYLDIYAKPMTREGHYPIVVKAMEHYNGDYNFVKKEYRKQAELKVER